MSLRRSTRLPAVAKISTAVSANEVKDVGPKKRAPKKTKETHKSGDEPAEMTKKAKPNPKQPEMDASGEEAAPKKTRARKVKEEPVYVIPDVAKKTTTFHGRLGYACLNTILRNQKPSVFCSRTCRIDTIKTKGIDFVKDLGRQNAEDLISIIEWNEKHHIRFLRVSSNLFPFASHPEHHYPLTEFASVLGRAGDLAVKYNHRLTTHPGQYTQLGSPRPEVVQKSISELAYHAEMLDLLKAGKDGVMIIHGGGVYDDKPATIERMKESIRKLPTNVRERLVLENDEMCYNAEDLLPICEELDVPLVFDYHHDALYPSPTLERKEIIRRANTIFEKRGIRPKQHLSEERPGALNILQKRAHADRCESLPEDLPDDMDLMIEAKDKEQAVLHLYRIYDLAEIDHKSLRPPTPPEEMKTETNGRKSSRRRKEAEQADATESPKRKRKPKAKDEDEFGDEGSEDEDEARVTVMSPRKRKANSGDDIEERPSAPKKSRISKAKEAVQKPDEEVSRIVADVDEEATIQMEGDGAMDVESNAEPKKSRR